MNKKHAIGALLFDKDGTLVDFDRTWGPATESVMRDMANGDAETFDRLVAVNHFDVAACRLKPSSPMIAGSHLDYGPGWAKALGVQADAGFIHRMDTMFAEVGLQHLVPIRPLVPLFERLKASGFPLGIATNDGEAAARRQMQALGIEPFLSYVAGYDSGHGPKPGPGMVRAFIQLTGLSPNNVAMVGDTLHDLHAARAAGALAVAVLTGPEGASMRGTLAPYADLVFEDLDELLEYVGA